MLCRVQQLCKRFRNWAAMTTIKLRRFMLLGWKQCAKIKKVEENACSLDEIMIN